MTTKKQIAILGGTFDPLHKGHIDLLKKLQKKFQFDEILLIPSHTPPHRETPRANEQDRLAMVELAITKNLPVSVDRCEIDRAGPSYTVDTLKHLREKFGSNVSLSFIMGVDAFQHFTSWYNWQEILPLANLIIISRPTHELKPTNELTTLLSQHEVSDLNLLKEKVSNQILLVKIKTLDISSTEIREKLSQDKEIKKLLPAKVYSYIKKHNLYSEVKNDMTKTNLTQTITTILDDLKAEDCVTLDVKKMSTITDSMVVCSATSNRHLFALAKNLAEEVKVRTNVKANAVDGEPGNNWVVVDFGEVIVHIMLKEARESYDLESLWKKHTTRKKTAKKGT